MPDRVAALAARRWNEAAHEQRAREDALRAAEADEYAKAREDESLRERYARWWADPAAFAMEAFEWPEGQGLFDYQRRALRTLARTKRLAVRSGHGAGKSGIAAFAVLWFVVTREQRGDSWKVPTTASVWRQLDKYLWPEIHSWVKRLRWDLLGMEPWRRGRQLLDMSIKLEHGEAFAAASNDEAKLEGAHAQQVLFVLDEAKTIPTETFDAAEGALTGGRGREAYALTLSTPGVPVGRFHAIHTHKPGTENWSTQHITVDEVVAAGQVDAAWVESMRKLWAATPGIFANRVEGEFAEDEGGLIKLSWIDAANDRWDEGVAQAAVEYAGFDVARFGADQTVIALVAGDVITRCAVLPPGDSIATAQAALPYVGVGVAGPLVVIDAIGVGAGVYDQLRRQRELPTRLAVFEAGGSTNWRDVSGLLTFANVRSAAWWHVKELLDPTLDPRLALPVDDELAGDLVAPTWRHTSRGILVEPKDEMKSRLGRSPDKGDAVVMALWGRILRASMNLRPPRSTNGHRKVASSITGDLLDVAL